MMAKPRGVPWPVDARWKREIRAAIDAAKLSRNELARRIDCHPTTLSSLFAPSTHMSRLVAAIHDELGLPLPAMHVGPAVAVECGLLREVMESWPRLSQEQRRTVLRMVDAYAPPRGAP